jgi:hypothetical protein
VERRVLHHDRLHWAVIKVHSHYLELVTYSEASETDIQEAINAFLKLVNGKLVRYYKD